MWEVAIWFFIIMFAVNGFALWLDSVIDNYSLINPFTNSTMTLPAQPNVNNTLGNITATTATNATGGSGVGLWDAVNYGWNGTIWFFNLITGGFILQTIAAFVPNSGDTAGLFGIIQGTILFFLIITLLHIFRNIF